MVSLEQTIVLLDPLNCLFNPVAIPTSRDPHPTSPKGRGEKLLRVLTSCFADLSDRYSNTSGPHLTFTKENCVTTLFAHAAQLSRAPFQLRGQSPARMETQSTVGSQS
jgi:hypothetical protein